jgi:hypothetical protein
MKTEWKFEEKRYQIADTGDYDGHVEISNNKGLVLISREEYDDGDLEALIDTMNRIDFIIDTTSHEEEKYRLFLENKHLKEQSQQSEWVSVEDRLPTLEEHGEKVLIHRLMNDSQKLLAYSVHDTKMVKYCDKDTFWKPLTPPNR